MDICRISRKEEFLAAFAAVTRTEQEALLAATAADRPVPMAVATVLALAVPAVCIAVLPGGPYLWVAAALLLSIVYPVVFWLPLFRHDHRTKGTHGYLRTLGTLGLLDSGRKLGYLAANAFVINARAVAPAFAWFAAVNLVVAIGWIEDGPPSRGLGIVIAVQSVLALGYGLAVWRMTPGVGRLRERTAAVRSLFAAHRAIGWTLLVLLTVPVALGAVLLIPVLTIPEPPVLEVLAGGHVGPAGQTLVLLLLLSGLYAVTRTVHGRESRRLARQVAGAIIRYIDGDLGPRLESGAGRDCEEYRSLATGLLEARVYRFVRTAVFGRLPVYILSPDLSLVSDKETLSALRGHLNLEPAG
ncbi:MAG: hypothetical protein ABFC89_13705 [Methanospirillum sp.]